MDKNEILKKSRELKQDEGAAYIESKGRSFGAIGFCSMFIVIVFVNMFNGKDNFVPFTMFWAYSAAEAYGKYCASKSKKYIISTILSAIASICFFVCYILKLLGVGA